MSNYISPKPWNNLSVPVTPEKSYYNRRALIKRLGIAGSGMLLTPLLMSSPGCQSRNNQGSDHEATHGNHFYFNGMSDYYPAQLNSKYTLDRPLTLEYDATHKNNFYEFISREDPDIYNVYKFVDDFDNRDWKIEVTGLAENTGTFYLEDLIKRFTLEERTYRFRCVERWAMAVPWTGFRMADFIKFLAPKNNAKYIRMISYSNPDQMEGVRNLTHFPWPYFEGLTIEEAMNELTLMATGIYGKPLPKQNGAPVRLVVPWKYGYKNIKSIVKMEFVDFQPETFWHKLFPQEYPFTSNIDPKVPHPRWSQEYEQMIPDGEKRPTLKYNGYGEFVGHLYS